MQKTGDQQLLKRINRSVLLRLLKQQPGLSRAKLSEQSGLTKSTVSALVRELISEQWLSEANATVAAQGKGRPSMPLRINTQTRVLVGVEIAVESVRAVCVDLDGQVLAQEQAPLSDMQPSKVCAQAAQLVAQLCLYIDAKRLLLSGVGVCLPGAIAGDSGVVHFAPNLGWRGVPFLSLISEAFAQVGVSASSIHLQNDADAAALGEYEFSSDDNDGPLIFVNCNVGVGAGIVLNDRLFTGAVGTAGEIGHTILQVDGPRCSCGRKGCAETYIGSRAIAGQNGAQAGSEARAASIEQAGRYLGVLIQNLDVTFNPRVVVVGGKSCISYPNLLAIAIKNVAAYAQSAGVPAPQLRTARYGLWAAAVGGAALVWHRFLRPIPVV